MTHLRRHCFTLLEMVVVAGLLAVVIAAATLGLFSVLQTWDRVSAQSTQFQDTLTLDRTLETILANAIPLMWKNDEYQDVMIFHGEPNDVTLAYEHRLNRLEDGAIRCCRLRLEQDELVCYYVERPPMPESLDSERVRRSVLARNVASLELSYADLDDQRLVMVEDWGDRLYLPLAIQVRVQWRDGGEQVWFQRVMATSWFERMGRWEQKVKP
jgi:type II secretory pathway component PulJ